MTTSQLTLKVTILHKDKNPAFPAQIIYQLYKKSDGFTFFNTQGTQGFEHSNDWGTVPGAFSLLSFLKTEVNQTFNTTNEAIKTDKLHGSITVTLVPCPFDWKKKHGDILNLMQKEPLISNCKTIYENANQSEIKKTLSK